MPITLTWWFEMDICVDFGMSLSIRYDKDVWLARKSMSQWRFTSVKSTWLHFMSLSLLSSHLPLFTAVNVQQNIRRHVLRSSLSIGKNPKHVEQRRKKRKLSLLLTSPEIEKHPKTKCLWHGLVVWCLVSIITCATRTTRR